MVGFTLGALLGIAFFLLSVGFNSDEPEKRHCEIIGIVSSAISFLSLILHNFILP